MDHYLIVFEYSKPRGRGQSNRIKRELKENDWDWDWELVFSFIYPWYLVVVLDASSWYGAIGSLPAVMRLCPVQRLYWLHAGISSGHKAMPFEIRLLASRGRREPTVFLVYHFHFNSTGCAEDLPVSFYFLIALEVTRVTFDLQWYHKLWYIYKSGIEQWTRQIWWDELRENRDYGALAYNLSLR